LQAPRVASLGPSTGGLRSWLFAPPALGAEPSSPAAVSISLTGAPDSATPSPAHPPHGRRAQVLQGSLSGLLSLDSSPSSLPWEDHNVDPRQLDHSTCWSEDPAAGSPDTNPPERKQTDVQVYLRMRPTPEPTPLLGVRGEHKNILVARLPRKEDDLIQGVVDNSKQEHTFHFDAVFPMDTTQEKVFEVVAIPVLHNLMKGINGTIFAYGQTGTGKTFTITGGAESYNDRGIIPRALSFIFSHIKQDGLAQYSVAISYLEIYQDKGYDLLTKAQADARRIDDLQKASSPRLNDKGSHIEDQDGNLVLRGLSVNTATTEEEALHLLFLGDTNRIVAETPLNDSSTRSHCTFIIWIEAREPGSSVMRKSKLHLVDLAGSERVKQSGTIPNETVFREACSINLALHYLEQVIVALHERATGRRVHVPYRNSMMTTVLRDSLGGNCQTVMIATVTPERDSMPETVSTCRFAQAVARIENQAVVNEEVDPSVLIKRLTRENEELREQLQYMKSHTAIQLRQGDDLTEEERKKCEDYVDAYIEAYSEDPEARPLLGPDVEKIRFAFKVFRDRCIQMKKGLLAPSAKYAHSGPTGTDDPPGGQHAVSFGVKSEHQCEVAKLKLHVQQRDAEIAILIDMLNRNGISPVPDSKGRPGVHGSHGFLRSFFCKRSAKRTPLGGRGLGARSACQSPSDCLPCTSAPMCGAH
ncbi:kinesin-related protein 3a, partial [Cystoisospora suis]